MVVDSNIQMQAGWGTHVQSDGSNIAPGASDPTFQRMIQGNIPLAPPTAAICRLEGISWAAVEHYIIRPVQANTGRLTLDFDLTAGADFLANAWIKETDTELVTGGKKFNMSLQRIMATNAIQISNQAGAWVPTGFIAPPFVAGVPLHHKIDYGFDAARDLYGVERITIGGVEFLVGFPLEDLPDIACTWTPGAYFQNQDQLGGNGGTSTYLIDNVQYTWG